jgi:hypothetical protein
VIIKDILKYGCEAKKIDPTVLLPRRTLESYYQQIVEGRAQLLNQDNTFNEVIPLLYLSLKYQYKHFVEQYLAENKISEELEDPFTF